MRKSLLLFLTLITFSVSGAWADDWTPSIPAKAVIVTGDKVASVTAATAGDDNAHWYFITQVRGGESVIYDTGSQVKRGPTSATAASFEYTSATTNKAYLVRFISTGADDTYNIQFGNGRYVQAYDGTPGNNTIVNTATTPGTYVFYNCNNGSGSYFGWNLNTKGGKIVDNNGAGGTVSYWDSGTVSGTSGNNVYYVYEVAIEEGVNVTYNLYESDGETLVSTQTILQRKNSEKAIPSSFKSGYLATDYTYEETGTIGTSDCTINVVRTLKANGNATSLPVGAYLYVGDAATSMTAATSASDNDHWYLIMQDRGNTMTPLYDVSTYGTICRALSSVTAETLNGVALSGNEQYLVRFIETGSGLYNMQFANGNYIAPASSDRSNGVTLVSVQTNASAGTFAFYVHPDASSTFGWNVDSKSDGSMLIDNNGLGGTVTLWGTGTSPSGTKLWTIYPVTLEIPSYLVKYAISDGSGVIYTSDEFPASNGDVITELPSVLERAFCSYDVTETTVTSAGVTTVPVTMTWNGPFNISASFATADWKLLQMRQGGYNVKYVADAASYPLEAKGLMTTEDDAYLWALTGNPYDGFEIMNKAAGSTKKLYAGASPANGTYPLMSSENTTKWIVNGNPKNSEAGGFGLQVPGKSLYINDFSNAKKLSFWQQSTSDDVASTLTVAKQYTLLVANNISPYFNSIGALFSLKDNEGTTSMSSTWTAALTTCDKSTYDALMSFVSDAANICFPESGFYRIKNKNSNKYVGYGQAGYAGKGVGLIEVEANNLSSVLYLNKVSDGVYKISTQGLNVQKQSDNNIPVRASSEAGANHTFSVLTAQVVSIRADVEDSYGYWFRSSWGSAPESIITWAVSGDVAKWSVEAASTVDISLTAANDNTSAAHTYATLCVPFEITGLTGANSKEVKAYSPTKSGDYIVPGDGATTVTEGTPVLLIGEEGATSVTAAIGSSYATTPATSNVLTGTFTGTTIDCTAATGTNYVLGFDSTNGNRIGFYHVSGGSAFALGANRAYLKLDGSGDPTHVKGFAINFGNDIADGVNAVKTAEDNGKIFDLSGREVSKPVRGIYIKDGRKVVVK